MPNEKLIIKRGSTPIIKFDEFPEGSIRSKQLMDHDYIKIPFSTENPIYFKRGDYCDAVVEYGNQTWNIGRFELTDMVRPKFNENTSGYDYELQIDAQYWKWKNKRMKFQPDSGSPELAFSLTAGLSVHLNVFLSNLATLGTTDSTYLYNGTTAWGVAIDNSVDASKAQLVEYDNFTLIDVLNKLAELWECEWWVVDNVIHFGKCESQGTETVFALGDNVETMGQSDNKADYATRLYVFGAEKNLPANYRQSAELPTVNGVVQRRLMLPAGTPFIQDSGVTSEHEAVEAVVFFDDIFPKMECIVGAVNTYQKTVEEDDGTTTTQTFYRVSDTSGFITNLTNDMRLDGESFHIIFTSGSMNGMEFECELISNDSVLGKCFEVIMNETYGRKLPDADLHPIVTDKYVITNWDSTQMASLNLIATAEQLLLTEGQKYLAKSKIDPNTYPCTMMSSWIENDGAMRLFEIGDRVKLVNSTYFASYRSSRIIGYEWSLDIPYDSPKYIVGEKASTGRMGSLEGQINAITLGGKTYNNSSMGGFGASVYVLSTNDATAPTDRNVFSSLRSLYSFLRKDLEDSARAILHFLKGATFGRFIHGWSEEGGQGARIDEYGNAEFESIRSRGFIETMELRFNRIDVVSGELWNSIAFGLIEAVDLERQIVTLKLEDGELSGIHEGDICRGMFHNLSGNPTTELREDGCGFVQIAGFSTAYFTPTEVYDNGARFKYALKSGTTKHPCVGMKFSVYGSFTDPARRASAYSNRYYKRYLSGVDTWVIDADRHIAFQSGLLEGLTIGGVQMHGYGTFLNNVYMTGVNVQFNNEILDDLQGDDAYSVVLSQYEGVVLKDEEGNIISSNIQQMNVISGSSNVTANNEQSNVVTSQYALSTTIQASRGATALVAGSPGAAGQFSVSLNAVGCTAITSNGVVYITAIDTTANARYVDITVNCEGNRTFVLRYGVSVVLQANGFVVVDFDNEMASFASKEDGTLIAFSNVTTHARMWNGNDRMIITYAEIVSLPPGITATYTLDNGKMSLPISQDSNGDYQATLVITGFSNSAAMLNNIEVKLTGKIAADRTQTITKSSLFKLNKVAMGSNAMNYEIQPSVDQIQVDKDGNVSTNVVSATVLAKDGKDSVTEITTAAGLDSNLFMTVQLINQSGENLVTGSKSYTVGSNVTMGNTFPTQSGNITFSKDSVRLVFLLYYQRGVNDNVLLDKEGIPLIKNGKNSIKIHLDTPVDVVLVNQDGVIVDSQNMPATKASLYDGEVQVTDSTKMQWAIEYDSNDVTAQLANSYNSDMSKTVSITALAAEQAEVTIKCQYKNIWYSEKFPVKKLVGLDDYEIEVTPSQLTYNPNTGTMSASSISVKVWRQGVSGARTNIQSLPTGYGLGYSIYTTNGNNGASVTNQYSDGEYVFNNFGSTLKEVRFFLTNASNVTVNTKSVMVTNHGTNGTNGNPGTQCFLTAPVGTVGFTRAGYATPSSFAVKSFKNTGGTTAAYPVYFRLFAYNGSSWSEMYFSYNQQSVKVNSTKASVVTINPSDNTSYRQYLIRAYDSDPTASYISPANDGCDYVAELAIGVALNGLQGDQGENGYFPRDRGFYRQGEHYYYHKVGNEIYRDKVVAMVGDHYYNFLVKTRDDSGYITAAPSAIDGTDPYWEMMSQYQTLIADTLFGNNANIGGFMTSNELMRSSTVLYRIVYKGTYSSSTVYGYTTAESQSDNIPKRDMVKYGSNYYVILHQGNWTNDNGHTCYGNYIPATSTVMAPYYTEYWRKASAKEIEAVTFDENGNELTGGTIDFPLFELNGTKGAIRITQSEETGFYVDENGVVTAGKEGGQRVEISPLEKRINIFNSSGQQVAQFDGDRVSTIDDLFGNSSGSMGGTDGYSGSHAETPPSGWHSGFIEGEEILGTFNSFSNMITVVANGTLSAQGYTHYNTSYYDGDPAAILIGGVAAPTQSGGSYLFKNYVSAQLVVGHYSNGKFYKDFVLAMCEANGNSNSNTFSVSKSVYGSSSVTYYLAVCYKIGLYYSPSLNYGRVAWSGIKITYAGGSYISRVFGNGFVYGMNGANFMSAVAETINGATHMHVKAITGGGLYGFEANKNGLYVYISGRKYQVTVSGTDAVLTEISS